MPLRAQYQVFLADTAAYNNAFRNAGQGQLHPTSYALISIFGSAINLYKASANSPTVYRPLDLITGADGKIYVNNKPCQ